MRKVVFLIIIWSLSILGTSCSPAKSVEQVERLENLQPPQQTEHTFEIVVPENIQIVRSSFSELGHYADAIVIGEVVNEIDGYINTARDPSNISKPSSSLFNIGKVYKVKVEEYLKGADENTIFVVQRIGSMLLDRGMDPINRSDIDRALAGGKGITPLQSGVKYLLFLYSRSYDIKEFSQGPLYSSLEEPWRFTINENDTVIIESSLVEKLTSYFPDKPSDKVIAEINTPFVLPTRARQPTPAKTTPYPAPVDSTLSESDAVNKGGVTPYP